MFQNPKVGSPGWLWASPPWPSPAAGTLPASCGAQRPVEEHTAALRFLCFGPNTHCSSPYFFGNNLGIFLYHNIANLLVKKTVVKYT